MNTQDVVALPFMFVCTFVCGFLLNTCSARKRVSDLEYEVDELEWKLSDATYKIEKLLEEVETSTVKSCSDK
jgi:hypothetical protein